MTDIISSHRAYIYISKKASCDPAKTIYICAPEYAARDEESAEKFAVESGWQAIAEEQEAVLVLPVAEHGWKAEPSSLLLDFYNETKNSFKSRSGSAIWGRGGSLWCWETVLYVVGYQEGAEFAGNALVEYPNFAAATALVGGLPTDYSAGEQPSNHWMVRNVSEDYALKNKDIPVCLWLFAVDEKSAAEAVDYFGQANGTNGLSEREQIGAVDTIVIRSKKNPAQQVRLVTGQFSEGKQRSQYIFDQMIAHLIRWKNGPDGTLALMDSKAEFYSNPRFIRHRVDLNGTEYDYFVHLPEGKGPEQVKGLPVVFTVHGRGEPAWMFTTKNGWDALADETGEFIVVSPDSPGNIWFILRDGEIFQKIICQLDAQYHIDTTRIYLTGFSNGSVMTREMAYYQPQLFAAISPSNGPWFDTRSMQLIDASKPPKELSEEVVGLMENFAKEGWEMPCAFFFGDNDPTAAPDYNPALPLLLKANHCGQEPDENYTKENYFTPENGFKDGDRFATALYHSEDGVARVCVTIMKNMPHGAITEECRFAWSFLKRFRRAKDSKQVELLNDGRI